MTARYLLLLILLAPFYPYLWLQSKWIRWRTPKLPEARNDQGLTGTGGNGTFNLITIGESTMAGVGVDTHEEGFTGTLAERLANRTGLGVRWKVYAQRGLTAERVLKEQVPQISENGSDLIVIGLGANDTFKMHSPGKWRRDVLALIRALRQRFPRTPIVFINMPPIDTFPALSAGIKIVLRNVVSMLGGELEQIAASEPGLYYYNRRITLEDWIERHNVNAGRSAFFSDGVHPSRLTYQIWARDVAGFIFDQPGLLAAETQRESATKK